MKIFNLMTLCAVASVALVSTAAAQDVNRGKALFAGECSACHSVVPGQNGIGPSLAHVYGMPAGAPGTGYKFSVAMQESHVVWTEVELDKFLMTPDFIAAGTKMPLPGTEMHMGVPSADDRADLIAYLRSLPRS